MNKETLKEEINYLFNDLVDQILQDNFSPQSTTVPYGNVEVISSAEYLPKDIESATEEAKDILRELVEGLHA
jgi:hypothetical protein